MKGIKCLFLPNQTICNNQQVAAKSLDLSISASRVIAPAHLPLRTRYPASHAEAVHPDEYSVACGTLQPVHAQNTTRDHRVRADAR